MLTKSPIEKAAMLFSVNHNQEKLQFVSESFGQKLVNYGVDEGANIKKFDFDNISILFYDMPNNQHRRELVCFANN